LTVLGVGRYGTAVLVHLDASAVEFYLVQALVAARPNRTQRWKAGAT
jgi:hypothetical protein